MRRKRFQRGSLKPRKRNGKLYWYAQWREYREPRSKELGLCSTLSRAEAETMLAAILQPINEGVGKPQLPVLTFKGFVDSVYLPVYRGKWKASTAMTEEDRIQVHLIGSLQDQLMTKITRENLQSLLNKKAKVLARSGVDHLRFRLRSIFTLAISESVVERNPAVSLYTPRNCKKGVEKLVLTPEDIGLGKTLRTNSGPCNVMLRSFRMFSLGRVRSARNHDWVQTDRILLPYARNARFRPTSLRV